jgi:RimJ/RimL family protein N-acetyltransferase
MAAAANVTSFVEAGDLRLLKGRYVYLEYLTEQHREVLRPLARDERIWEFTKTLLITETYDRQFDDYFDQALSFATKGDQTFAIVATDGAVIGMTRVYDIDRKVRKATIGHTWYVPEVWGKAHNKECKLLLLQYVFDTMGFARVDFKVASQNLRSQKAVEKIGGVKEGVLRRFALRNDGTSTDAVIFSILDDEWPANKLRLQEMCAVLG